MSKSRSNQYRNYVLTKKSTATIATYIAGIILIIYHLMNQSAIAQTQDDPNAENIEVNLLPDFNNISFRDFDSIRESGEIGTELNEEAGRDISRQFNQGDNIEDVLQLGDLEAGLAPEQFTLNDINERLEEPNDFTTLPLSEFPLLEEQTLENLVNALPNLGEEQAEDIEPINALLEQEGVSSNSDLNSLIEDESVAELELGSISLENFSLDSIPNLADAELENFENFEQSTISEVPGLSDIPLGDFPGGISLAGTFIARIDLVWGAAESDRNSTISGSFVEGFNVPCDSNCEHLELDDIENIGSAVQSSFEGSQWIAGRENRVQGGTGCFSGFREPTGIHPFGPTFKLVLWRTDETTDTAEIVIYFNVRARCGESPYIIGPFPFPLGQVRINDYIFIGSGAN